MGVVKSVMVWPLALIHICLGPSIQRSQPSALVIAIPGPNLLTTDQAIGNARANLDQFSGMDARKQIEEC